MPRKVTYGVSGLLDWTAIIPVGKARMNVHFSGGAITKYGITPAEFTTTDPLTQRIIEESHYYRSGKIVILRSVGHHQVKPLSNHTSVENKDAFENATLPFDEASKPINIDKSSAPKTIDVACIEDAIEYMRDNYNIPTVMMRNVDALRSVASQHGITFNIK